MVRCIGLMLLSQIAIVHTLISTPLKPPMYPLAVRSPYLSTWIQGSRSGTHDQIPEFWNGQKLGWTALIRFNGSVHSLFGGVPAEIQTTPAKQISQSYTLDTVRFGYQIGALDVELKFSNPITPQDYKRQSIPFSYLEAILSSSSASSSVDLYLDINGAWSSGDPANLISWSTESIVFSSDDAASVDHLQSHNIKRTSQLLFTEAGDMAEWGDLYWTTDQSNNMTMSSGFSATTTRQYFAKHGALSNETDSEFRPINLEEPVFAFAKSFKSGQGTQSALFTIGLVQDQAMQVNMPKRGYQVAHPLYQRFFNTTIDMITWHYADYKSPSHQDFSQRAMDDSRKVNHEYSWTTSLCTIQAMAGTQFVIDGDDPNGPPHLWMKEISSDGNMQTSDVLFPAFPFFLYANPKMALAMLEPLLIHQEGGLYPHKYAMHDMGSSYPNATGHVDGADERMPVEECGNNLIMMLATHDALLITAKNKHDKQYAKQWITKHYDIALQWSQYLIDYGLITESQLSTDDFAGTLANQTNLAIKAIVGIKCMSIIAGISNHAEVSEKLDRTATEYVNQWISLAYDEGVPFAKLAYQWKGSWGTLYNLFPDRLLNLYLFPTVIYEQQDAWYSKVIQRYGIPLDSRHLYTKLDWQLFVASFSSSSLSNKIYSSVAKWINETTIYKPLIDLYETIEGVNAINMFTNRPVVGAAYAHLAMIMMEEGRAVVSESRTTGASPREIL